MNRPTSRRCIRTVSGIASAVLLVPACAEGPLPVEVNSGPAFAVIAAPQNVSWTGDGAPGGFCPTVATGATRAWTFLLTTPDAAASALTATFHEGERTVPATLVAFADNNIVLTAKTPGSSGDLISATFVGPAVAFAPLSVTWIGTQLVVSLATDGAGRPTTTAAQLVAALNAHPAGLVTAALAAGSDGSGIAQPEAERHLAGGGLEQGASLAVNANDDIRFTAIADGPAGNAASVEITDPGLPNTPLTLRVDGSRLIVTLATSETGAFTTTASQLIAATGAIFGSPVSAALLTGSDGTGRVGLMTEANLSGGGVEEIINEYQVAGVKKGGGRSPFEFSLTTTAEARLLSAEATGGSRNSRLMVDSCD